MATVDLEHVTVRHDAVTALDDVSVHVADGELLGVIGGSGSGKTTLLRAVAGLVEVAAGTVRIAGVDVTAAPTAARGVSMVFQRAALIPHRDVRGNVAFPLELRHDREPEIDTRVTAETRALHIEELLARSPRELSTGEAQLVQVARALVRTPRLLLLDEPLAGLDSPLTSRLRLELRSLQQGYAVTTLLATNDPLEAMTMPDRLVVMEDGRIVQAGTPLDVYERPATLTAAAATGAVSTVPVTMEAEGDTSWLVHPGFRLRSPCAASAAREGARVVLAFRPTAARIAADGPVHGVISEVGIVTGTVTVALDGSDAATPDEVVVAAPGPPRRRGERVALHIPDVLLFDATTGASVEAA